MNDDALRRAYAELLKDTTRTGRGGCPAVDALAAVVDRKGDEEGRLAVLDHVMSCLPCRRDFEILRAVGAPEPAPARRRIPLALAASILLLLAATLVWNNARVNPAITRSGEPGIVLLTSGTLSSAPVQLTWRRASGVTAPYAIEVLGPDATVLCSGTTTDTMIALPDTVPLSPGVGYRWWVRTNLAGGEEIKSNFREFQLKAP